MRKVKYIIYNKWWFMW